MKKALDDTVKYRPESMDKHPTSPERLLGNYSSGEEGPALVITADAFDGQTSGIIAFNKVLEALMQSRIPFKGELTGLAGNIKPQKKGILTQLKQSLSIGEVFLANHAETPGYNEAAEFVDLIEEYEKASHSLTTGVFYLDLKTCANIRRPYICSSKNPSSWEFAGHFPLPKIRGIEEYVTDHMGFYLNAKSYTGCTLFVGPNGPYPAEQVHEAAIWLAMVNSGCVKESDIPNFSLYQDILQSPFTQEKIKSFEVIYKYCIQEDEFFRMMPGFENFHQIRKGEVLATSDGGSVVSQWEGRIFMPLYHIHCQDGFFILKEYK